MDQTMVGWLENVAGAIVSQLITAIADEHVRVEGDNIVIPHLNNIVGIYPIGLDIRNVQLSSPSLRTVALMDVAPVENAALPVTPPDFSSLRNVPIPLEKDEQLTCLLGNSNVGAQDEAVFIQLAEGPIMPYTGKCISVLCTATAPAVANTWQNAPLVFSQVLPVGTYDIVGARCEQATTFVFRLVLVGGTWRPGGVASAAIDSPDIANQRYGGMGVWGTFEHLRPPTIDFCGDGTGGAARIYLDLVKR